MEQFQAAIAALFNPHDFAAQQAANQWLNDFATTPAAWEASLSILEPNLPSNVSFFAANMLLNKARTEWHRLPHESRGQLTSAISGKLQHLLQQSGDVLVCQRLCLVLAAMATRTGEEAVQAYMAQALSMASQAQSAVQLQAALLLLTEAQQENADLDTHRSAKNCKAMSLSSKPVLELLQQILSNIPSAGGESIALAAVKCLHAWCESGSPLGKSAQQTVTLARVHMEHPALFTALFGLLGTESTELQDASVTVIVALLGAAPDEFDGFGGGAVWQGAMVRAAAYLVALRPGVEAGGERGAEVARTVARCGTAMSEASVDLVAGCLAVSNTPAGPTSQGVSQPAVLGPSQPEVEAAAISLADLMLACLSRPERSVADAALDYFINLNTVPVAHRLPQLRAAVFASAVPLLLRQACYPPTFTTWQEEEEDEEAFYQFRDNNLAELLECCYNMMGQQYLVVLQAATSSAASWQQYEAALFCLRAVNLPVKLKILGRDRADTGFDSRAPEEMRAALEAHAVMHAVFSDLCSRAEGGPAWKHLSSRWVLREAARMIGEYATWFGRAGALPAAPAPLAAASPSAQAAGSGPSSCAAGAGPQPPLEPALNLLLLALPVAEAQRNAAQAFRNVCIRCCNLLYSPATLRGLMDAAMRVVAPPPSSSETSAGPGPAASVSPPSLSATRSKLRNSSNSGFNTAPGGSLALGSEERSAVVEGLGRVVAVLPPESMGEAGVALTAPLVLRAQALAQAGTSVRVDALGGLADDLALLAAALRFMDFPGNPPPGLPHPALKVLEHAWPVLAGVAEHPMCQREPSVVAALCEVYQRALMSARGSARGLLPMLIHSVGAMFGASPHPGPCDVLGTAVELFGEMHSMPEVAALQAQALVGAVSAAGALLSAATAAAAAGSLSPGLPGGRSPRAGGHGSSGSGSGAGPPNALAAYGDLIRALYSCADRYFVFARDTLLTSPALGQLFSWGSAVVGLREREPVAAALAFLTHIIAITDKLTAEDEAAGRARVEACMAADGEALMRALVRAAADSCPRQLARPLAGALWSMLHSSVFGNAAAAWLAAAMQGPEFQDMTRGVMTAEESARFCTLLVRRPPLPRGRFDALVADLSGVLRGEAAADVVLAYEM